MATFQDIIGQDQMKEHLMGAIQHGKVSHAYLINGERSSGKEFIAKVFAKALQCEEGGIENVIPANRQSPGISRILSLSPTKSPTALV